MKVDKLMQKDLVTCSLSCNAHDAAARMQENNVGTVLVVEDGGKLAGIVTDRDIAVEVVADSNDPQTTLVPDFMTTNPVTINSDADIRSALDVMCKEKIRRLPVVQKGKLVGLLSSADLAVELKQEFDEFLALEEAVAKDSSKTGAPCTSAESSLSL